MRRLALLLALLVALAAGAAAATTLDYRGTVLARRQVEVVLGDALRAPPDSASLGRALGRLCARLQDAGYLDARASAAWDTGAAPRSEPALRLEVREGRRYRIARLDFDTPAADSSGMEAAFAVRNGDVASPAALAEAASGALTRLAEAGFAYAQIGVSGFDWDSAGARVRLSGSSGPRVTITGVRVRGLRARRSGLAGRALAGAVGRPYQPAFAEAGRERLLQLGLFRSVTWEGLVGEADWSRARLDYQVEELRYNRFEGALGSRSEGGVTGLVRLDLGNLGGTGRVVGARWEGRGRGVESLAARYVEPLLLGAPLRFEGGIEQQREDTLFTRERVAGRLHFLLSGHEWVEAGFEQEHVLEPRAVAPEADLQSTVFALERDTRDPPLVPRRGARTRLSAAQTFKREVTSVGGRNKARSSAVDALAEWHRPAGPRLGLMWQLAGAARFSSQPVLSVFERYPLGGASTLRGFDEQAFRVDRYARSRFETRWFVGPGGAHAALFWDHAWTFTRVAEGGGTRGEARHHDGLGFGLRFEGPGGLIGVDYGLEPGRPPVEGKLHVQLVSSF